MPTDHRVTVDKEILNKAWMASFNRIPMSGPAKDWVDWLVKRTLKHEAKKYPRKRKRKLKDQEAFTEAVGAFAADLLLHQRNEASEGFMYRRLDREELSSTLVSGTNFEKLITYWSELDWLEKTGHIKAYDDFEGDRIDGYAKARRYRATPAFINDAETFQLTPASLVRNFEASHKHATVVQMRNSKSFKNGSTQRGKNVRIKGPKFQAQLTTMRKLNQLMLSHQYSLSEPPMLRRLFNCADRKGFKFDLGGRFYCSSIDNWMDIPKAERRKILIDGQQTHEIDVRASHLSILYALSEQPMPSGDPYDSPGYPREIVKQVIVAAIGSGKLPVRWPKGFNEAYKKEYGHLPSADYKLKDVVTAVVKKHPVLKKLKKDRLDWANLQFEESECFLITMLELHQVHGVPSLPVHDSLIVRSSDVFLAHDVLQKAYKSRLGFSPTITIPTEAWDTKAS